jgi:hypothetical protein
MEGVEDNPLTPSLLDVRFIPPNPVAKEYLPLPLIRGLSFPVVLFPHLYNNIFADTDITAQNFWIQIAFNTKPRRVMSAKVIPNI